MTAAAAATTTTTASMAAGSGNDFLRRIPLATGATIGLCCVIYAYQAVGDPNIQDYTMNPRMIVHFHQYYRLITSVFFHGSLMHIGMNMMSSLAIGSLLERRFGTIRLGLTILWAVLWTSTTYTLVGVILHVLFDFESLMYQHAVGFSGVIFHLSVLESNLSPQRSRSLFGFVSVPSAAYPWALLVALQFILPQVSFVGHLAGILTGTLQLYGVLDIFLPNDATLQKIENTAFVSRLAASSPAFVPVPISLDSFSTGSSSSSSYQRDPAALRQAVCHGISVVVKLMCDVMETIGVVVFGRGRAMNANIWLSGWTSLIPGRRQSDRTTVAAVDDEFEDDEWVGLPSPSSSSSSLPVSAVGTGAEMTTKKQPSLTQTSAMV